MSGLIDPSSHLNLDFPDHKVTNCVIAERFEIGAKIKISDIGFVFAKVHPSSFDQYGSVDYTQRLLDIIEKVKGIRASRRKT
jgi:hypothetical protein